MLFKFCSGSVKYSEVQHMFSFNFTSLIFMLSHERLIKSILFFSRSRPVYSLRGEIDLGGVQKFDLFNNSNICDVSGTKYKW